MGEIADSMLGGEMCEGCGAWLCCRACADAGVPAYCSKGCAGDRGAPASAVCRHSDEERAGWDDDEVTEEDE